MFTLILTVYKASVDLSLATNPCTASSSDKLTARRAHERKEQYKQVRAHVKKDDGRQQVRGGLGALLRLSCRPMVGLCPPSPQWVVTS